MRYTTPDMKTMIEPQPMKIPEIAWGTQEVFGSEVQANQKMPNSLEYFVTLEGAQLTCG
jgi:hypothetical protein